ncbi:hypothetical protein ACJMK2_002877, partial [Sinanodonta woodiana]
ISNIRRVCDLGKRTSVINVRDYIWTVQTAAHELGHSLGAEHDGVGEAAECKSEDLFLMATVTPQVNRHRTYIANIWTFSYCSIESFKRTLRNKQCVKEIGPVYNKEEYTTFMKKLPGDVFTPQEQCLLVCGQGYVYNGDFSEDLCYLLRCMNPVKGELRRIYLNAARGTKCGHNKWCSEGRC